MPELQGPPTHAILLAEARDVALTSAMIGLVVAFVVSLVVMGGLFLMFRKFYRIPPPDHAIIRAGHGGPRAVNSSGIWVIPIVHRAALLSLAPIRVDLTGTPLDSETARSQELPSVFQVAVMVEHDMILTAADRLLTLSSEAIILLVTDIVLDEYERLLAQANDDGLQDSPANRFIEGVEQALSTVGLTIVACRRQ